MKTRLSNLTNSRQSRGFVLMAAVLLLGVVSMAVLLSSLSANNFATEQAIRTQLALKEAKQALLGYVLLDDIASDGSMKPGSIPCPDANNDNNSAVEDNYGNNCSGSYINRFPEKNFRTGELRDAANEKLWYAISPGFRSGASDVNYATPATLTIDGRGGYVAVILAAGPPLSGQTRTDSAARSNFLELGNAASQNAFVSRPPEVDPPPFNDRVIGVSQKEWENAVAPRVASEIIGKLTAFYNSHGYFPRASPLIASAPRTIEADSSTQQGLLPVKALWPEPQPIAPAVEVTKAQKNTDWFAANKWHQRVYYAVAPAYAGPGGKCADPGQCLTLLKDGTSITGIKGLVILAGRPLDGHDREPPTVADFLEGAENQDDDNVFELPGPGSTSNDRFYIIK